MMNNISRVMEVVVFEDEKMDISESEWDTEDSESTASGR